MSCSTPNFSKNCSKGSTKSSVQLAKKAFRIEKEPTPNNSIPTWSSEYKKTEMTERETTNDRKKKSTVEALNRLVPIHKAAKTTGTVYETGMRAVKKKTFARLENEIVQSRRKRRATTVQKPKIKSLNQNPSANTFATIPKTINTDQRAAE